jgi:hypothetical protein
MVRPDASGILHGVNSVIEVWFEHDTGTETVERVAAKLDRYRLHLSGWPRTVLFELTSQRREEHLHTAWAATHAGFLVATTVQDRAVDPTGQVWRLLHNPGLCRLGEIGRTP